MMKGKKGLSTVVTTLILVLLVLAALAMIWGPIKGLLSKSSASLGQTKCLDVSIRATKVVNTTALNANPARYNVTIVRSASGDGMFGAKIVLLNDAGASVKVVGDSKVLLGSLEHLVVANVTGPSNATSVEVTPYYIDSSSKIVKLCNSHTTYKFNL